MTIYHFNYDNNAFLPSMSSCHSADMKTNAYKVALITGGNRGLGLQTARELGRLGIHLIFGVRDHKKGKAAVAELKKKGFHAEVVRLDVADLSTHAGAYDY